MNLIEKSKKILKNPVCDNCLGRQFAQLLHGYSNDQRGMVLRKMVAMSIDKEKYEPGLDMSNFSDYKFHNLEVKKKPKTKKCMICNNLFTEINKWAEKIVKKSEKYEFKTFLIGTILTFELAEKEEDLWENVGIDYCEPLKAEINRELGKLVEKRTKKRFNPKNPDISFLINLEDSKVAAKSNPFFIYGEYKKLKRGIPQTKWPSGKYRASVEQIIAKPLMIVTRGSGHKFHGLGREDIDARCLDYRPFVLEILEPKNRNINLKKIRIKDKRVEVRKLRFSAMEEVRRIKEAKIDKTYRVLVKCKNKIEKKELRRLKKLVGTIKQKTPKRVLHRRADRFRKRSVKSIKTRYINNKNFELIIRGEAGLYIKELVNGDDGRTKPNVSSLLEKECVCKELDVVKIHK